MLVFIIKLFSQMLNLEIHLDAYLNIFLSINYMKNIMLKTCKK